MYLKIISGIHAIFVYFILYVYKTLFYLQILANNSQNRRNEYPEENLVYQKLDFC